MPTKYLVRIIELDGKEYKIWSTVPGIRDQMQPVFQEKLQTLRSHREMVKTILDTWLETPGVEVEAT